MDFDTTFLYEGHCCNYAVSYQVADDLTGNLGATSHFDAGGSLSALSDFLNVQIYGALAQPLLRFVRELSVVGEGMKQHFSDELFGAFHHSLEKPPLQLKSSRSSRKF